MDGVAAVAKRRGKFSSGPGVAQLKIINFLLIFGFSYFSAELSEAILVCCFLFFMVAYFV